MAPPRILVAAVLYLMVARTESSESLEARRTSLAQLPLEKLLHVKQTLGYRGSELHEKGDTEPLEPDGDTPLPLRSQDWEKKKQRKPVRRGDWWEEEKDGKGKDISSLFQSTVTVLSFLAFGGYLLCLIVHAVKNGANNNLMTTTLPPVTVVGKKRRKRAAEEIMLRTLHRIAEAYVAHSILQPEPTPPPRS